MMQRRSFLKGGAVVGATTLVAAPAIAQSAPEIKWRLTSSFPKSLDTIYGTAQTFAKYVAEGTDNKFQIQTFAAGEIVPGLAALDAVSSGAVEIAQTPLYFYIGKEPALAYATGAPFGMNHRHQSSWWTFGGGADLVNEALKPFKAHAILCGNSGGRLVPQGDQDGRRSQRSQVPDRGHGWPCARKARRRAAAAGGRRCVSRTGERGARRHGVRRSL